VQVRPECQLLRCIPQASPDGQLLAFTLDTVGDERYSVRVRQLGGSGGGAPSGGCAASEAALAAQLVWSADSASVYGCQLVGAVRSDLLPAAAWRRLAPAPCRRRRALSEPACVRHQPALPPLAARRTAATAPAGWSGGLSSEIAMQQQQQEQQG
jgi:hypothetical protein